MVESWAAAGAVVNVVAPASSAADYTTRATDALNAVGFDVSGWDDIYRVGPDWPPADVDPSLVDAARRATDDQAVAWVDFHSFPGDSTEARG